MGRFRLAIGNEAKYLWMLMLNFPLKNLDLFDEKFNLIYRNFSNAWKQFFM